VFGWARLQPAEDRYDFDWLDRVLDLLTENGISACLATPTAAQPAWMSKRYPDILPVDVTGTRRRHGRRVNLCPNSPNYRRLSQEMARRLAEPRFSQALATGPGLCLPHLREVYAHAAPGERALLRQMQAERLRALSEDLREFARKSAQVAQGVREPFGPERDSWIRALRLYHGDLKG